VPLDVGLLVGLARVVRVQSIDVIHAHNYEAGVAALVVGRAFGVPFVFHGHSAMAEEMPRYVRRRWATRAMGRVGGFLDRSIPRAADACIAVTDALAGHLRAAGAVRVETLAPVLAPAEVNGHAPASREIPGTICYAGNLDAYQNLGLLLDAFARVRARTPAARLVLVSHRDARRAAAGLSAAGLPPAVEIVHATSYEEVSARLAQSQVLVLPRTEATGYPMKLLNYMAAGKAIVAAAGSAKGLRDGVSARIVADDDVAGFAEAIGGLLADDAARRGLGDGARAAVGDATTFAASLEAVERLYDEVRRR
jgi:glycosyltransferase involved in cell wall biosynthesis